jgi:hypothetical protein
MKLEKLFRRKKTMIIKVYNLYTNSYNEWIVPSKEQLLKNSVDTWGSKYDRIEHEVVSGGVPFVLKKVIK